MKAFGFSVLLALVAIFTAPTEAGVLRGCDEVVMRQTGCTNFSCTAICNKVFPNRGCTGKCLSDTECQCTCNKMDVFFVKPEKHQATLRQAGCTDPICAALCNKVFPNRGCTGKCLSDTECQCACSKMDVFFVKPEKKC